MTVLNEDFEYVVSQFGRPVGVPSLSSEALEPWRGKLPASLLDLWQLHGAGLMASGQFQFCDPGRFAPISRAVFGNDPDLPAARCHVIGFSAFGSLEVWSEDHGSVSVNLIYGTASCLSLFGRTPAGLSPDRQVAGPLYDIDGPANDAYDENGKPLFARARKALGDLAPGQIYGFVPMLALGGAPRLQNLKIVSALEHMALLVGSRPVHLIDTSTPAMKVVRPLG